MKKMHTLMTLRHDIKFSDIRFEINPFIIIISIVVFLILICTSISIIRRFKKTYGND